MAKIRNRCRVLSIVKTIQPCTMHQVHKYLETAGDDLTFRQVRSAFYQLIEDDEVVHFKNSETILGNHKPEPIFKIREQGDISLSVIKKRVREKNPSAMSTRIQAPMKYDESSKRILVRFRNDKLKLLNKLKRYIKTDREKDLLIGIINDYEGS